MTRFVPVTVVVTLLMIGGAAHAQSSLPNGATIVFEHRQIYDLLQKKFIEPQSNSTDLLHYFNLAHCNCAKADKQNPNGTFSYLVRETTTSGLRSGAAFFAGVTCEDAAHRNPSGSPTCTTDPIDTVSDIDNDLNASGGSRRSFNLYQIVNASLPSSSTTADCQQLDNVGNSIYLLIDPSGGTNYTVPFSQVAGGLSGDTGTASGIDTKPPPLPTSLVARPNENEIDISWKPPTANNTDIAYYQALCATAEGDLALAARSNDPQYVTTQSVCPGSASTPPPTAELPTPTVLDNGELEVSTPLPPKLAALDASFICGQANTGTASSLQIKHLQNGTPYQVILVAVDLHGNFSATYFDHTITPHLVTDFWEDLHERGSKTDGGLCLLAETYGDDSGLTNTLRAFRDDTLGSSRIGRWLVDAYYATLGKLGVYVHASLALRVLAAILLAPLVAFALLWHWLGVPGILGLVSAAWWYRRWRTTARRGAPWPGRRSLGIATAVALIVLVASPAHAGGGYQPYWDSDPTESSNSEPLPLGAPSLVSWHAGVRVGPYVPDIDNQFGMTPGPYEQMFGGSRILPMLDIDRFLWTGYGQVGVGISLGYMQKTAHTFSTNSNPADPNRARDPGAKNTFRLIPFELTATYRFTILDDDYGIPVVPYVRGGLAYYVWWVDAPSGGFARVCNDGMSTAMEPGCSTAKALGASLGVQGSIGLAIRAERIDASAAQSMRQSGIEHAGIYAELSLAKVDGFGSDKKLSVGDRTWFAGVDFEF